MRIMPNENATGIAGLAEDGTTETECPVCNGRGYLPCDDASEQLCEHCGGLGRVSAEEARLSAGRGLAEDGSRVA